MTPADGPFSSVRTDKKIIALTFDDGPDPAITPAVLAMLARTHARATFFTTGAHAADAPGLVRRTRAAGEIGSHSFDHPHLWTLSSKQVVEQMFTTRSVLGALNGGAPRWFRPPYGKVSPVIIREAAVLNEPIVLWDVAVDKYGSLPIPKAIEAVLSKIQPGSILLAHDACPPLDSAAWCIPTRLHALEIVEGVLKQLALRGWTVGTVSDLAAAAT